VDNKVVSSVDASGLTVVSSGIETGSVSFDDNCVLDDGCDGGCDVLMVRVVDVVSDGSVELV
jgi:hypothetical protein